MSLFGDEEPPAKSRLSLFDDESPASGSKSSLFADDEPNPSPWGGMPAPKKTSRGDLLKTLLSASEVPDSYIETFNYVMNGGRSKGGKMSWEDVGRVLSAGGVNADQAIKILSIVAPEGRAELSHNEFNVFLALIGLAQEFEDITLDSVDERRRNLPEPKFAGLSTASALPDTADLATKPAQRPSIPPRFKLPQPSPSKSLSTAKSSMEYPEPDPWGSPSLHKAHGHKTAVPASNGATTSPNTGTYNPIRTTSTIKIASNGRSTNGNHSSPSESTAASAAGPWGSYDPATTTPFTPSNDPTGGGNGFVGSDTRATQASATMRSLGGGRVTANNVEENVVVTLLPEKEGMFMFQHHNYQVSSVRRGSKVVRRYSDFVWLLDCLHKRYPFRQLPLLPPKRVGVNGNHLAADNTFIEKRRRGLARFCNALVRHPVLNQEQLVVMFLTVPTELAAWRKQATISVQEEFVGKALPPGLEDSLSPTLRDLFETTRSGVRRSAEIYINLCNLLDRLAKRNEGLAADHLRVSLSLQSLTNVTEDTYATDTNDVPLLNEGLNATAKHLSNSQSLLEDEARAWDQGVLEDLKRQRDSLVSMRDMFDRRDRYDKDNIPYLERRIQNNETKLANIRARPEGLVKPGEIEKVTDAIIKDKESIVAQHARGVFVKECIRDELIFFQQSQYHVSRWNQEWAQERVKYAELQADNWTQLNEELENMPVGE